MQHANAALGTALTLAFLAIGGISGKAMAGDEMMKAQRTVTVSASGTATAKPDQARIASGVVAEAATAKEALADNSKAMAGLLQTLKANGIDAKDIQTSSFSVDPRYTNPQDGTAPRVDGYRVSNQVDVVVRDLARLGEVLDAVIGAGANQVSGLTFEASTAETLRDAARKDAVANARRRAELFAAAAGAKVGDVVTIVEGQSGGSPVLYRAAKAAMDSAVPIESGSMTLTADVTVTWKLEN
ncbi:MAG: SIMPL domain-containing protein [Hyphomicrobium sp.]|nr:SIMPL domain-containing protein [Hyphomicrobium sp.]